jgi:hypothetical protein
MEGLKLKTIQKYTFLMQFFKSFIFVQLGCISCTNFDVITSLEFVIMLLSNSLPICHCQSA